MICLFIGLEGYILNSNRTEDLLDRKPNYVTTKKV